MNKRGVCHEGSLYLGSALLLLFLTVFMGIVLNQALLFSSLVRKKQEYTAHFYAADALAEYGVAHALESYSFFYPEPDGLDSEANPEQETRLLFEHWPEQESQSPYSGSIVISKQENGLGIQATLLVQGSVVQRVSCVLQKVPAENADQSFLRVTNWNK